MKRRGYTLVELLIVIGLLAVLTAGATMLLAAVILHVSRQRDNYQTAQVAARFAAAFREDAREAHRTTIADPASKVTFTGDGGTQIDYSLSGAGVERVETLASGTPKREFYRLPELAEVRFAREEIAPGRAIVTCVWRQPWNGPQLAERASSPLRDHRVEAALAGEGHHE